MNPLQISPLRPGIEVAAGDARAPLAENELALWLLDYETLAPLAAELAALLSSEERARQGRFLREEDRRRFALFHGVKRRLLGAVAGADPRALAFDAGPGGKPALRAGCAARLPHFNLSHSGDFFALAVAWAGPVGVDIERLDRAVDPEGIAARFFHPRERDALRAMTPDARRDAFFRWWAAKEAWLKAWGEGIGDGLEQLDFSPWPEADAVVLSCPPRARVHAWRFVAFPGVPGALVFPPAITRLRQARAQQPPAPPRR